jgi:hypothetical protein
VLRVVRHQRHHADAAPGGAVEALDLQEHAARLDEHARGGRGNAGFLQRAQGQVFAHEQVARAPVGGRIAGRRELDDHLPALAHGAELGLFAAGRRARQGALHGAVGHRGIVVGGHLRLPRGNGLEAAKRLRADHQVARQVFTAQNQRLQHVVVGPVLGVGGQAKFGVAMGEGPADEALGAHVGQEPGQAVVQRARAFLLVHPATPALQRHDAAEGSGLAALVDLDDAHFGADPFDVARREVHLRTRCAHLQEVRAAQQRCQRARRRGLADAKPRLDVSAGDGAPAIG